MVIFTMDNRIGKLNTQTEMFNRKKLLRTITNSSKVLIMPSFHIIIIVKDLTHISYNRPFTTY